MSSNPRIAVIGAGMAGLTVARNLRTIAEVTVLEKSARPGGRMATRHQAPWSFDHGAQYFTARDPRFQALLQPLLDSGAVTVWQPRITTLSPTGKSYPRDWFEPHYVPHGAMQSLGKLLADELDIRFDAQVTALARDGQHWWLELEHGLASGPFDWVVTAIPAAQAQTLLPTSFSGTAALARVQMTACFTLMLALEQDPALVFDCAVVKDSPLGWLALNHRRPGRSHAPALQLHSTNSWAEANQMADSAAVTLAMMTALDTLIPPGILDIAHQALQRWRYAAVSRPLGADYSLDESSRLAACGDWCVDGRVEAAFISGHCLAIALQARL